MKHLTFICIFIISALLSGCTTSQTSGSPTTVADDPARAAELNLELGLAYMERNDNEKALNKLLKSIKIDPQFADAHNALGILYSRLGEDGKAGDHFKRAVNIAPQDPRALNNYGQYLCRHNQRQEADKMFTRAVENPLYQTPEFAYLNAGICARDNQDLEKAEVHFRAALQENPYMAAVLIQMAELSHQLGRSLPARGYIERYGASTKHNARSLWLAIKIENALGDRDAAASYALQLKNKFPDSEETRLLLKMEGK
ncbi:MAG: type IV pilus biogenesis/stability protein PilW [Gammaproteobacteria bacterium]